jgi:hypothetical protein
MKRSHHRVLKRNETNSIACILRSGWRYLGIARTALPIVRGAASIASRGSSWREQPESSWRPAVEEILAVSLRLAEQCFLRGASRS